MPEGTSAANSLTFHILSGYYMIDVPDLDQALSWASKCPGASHGVVEVRPIWTM